MQFNSGSRKNVIVLGLIAQVIFQPAAVGAALPFGPSTDHHQHLFSPALAARINGSMSPEIAVPADIRAILSRREKAWGDPKALSLMLAADAETLSSERSGWIQGGPAVAKVIGSWFNEEVRLVPVQMRRHGNAVDLAGYYVSGQDTARQVQGYFQLTLEKGATGWKIAREIRIAAIRAEQKAITAKDLIAMLDEAGIAKAVILSEAFWWDSPFLSDDDPLDEVQAENEWTASQASQYPGRLFAFCSFNPTASYALSELDRCAADKRFVGLKLSFGMSGVDITRSDHLVATQKVFEAANRHKMPITIHLASGSNYSAAHARLFVDALIPKAPDVDIQVAHLWGGGPLNKPALDVLIDAVARNLPGTRRLTFDTAEIWTAGSPAGLRSAAEAIRAMGLSRIVYGSDAALNGRLKPADAWRRLQVDIDLAEDEYRTIAGNAAPIIR